MRGIAVILIGVSTILLGLSGIRTQITIAELSERVATIESATAPKEEGR